MPEHHRFTKDTRNDLAPAVWHDIVFDRREDGATDVRALAEEGLYDLSVGVTLMGIAPGTEVQVRAVEFDANGDPLSERPAGGEVHATGRGRFAYSWKGAVPPGGRVGVRVVQFGQTDAHLVCAEADVFTWSS
ncbi:hypothetical protein [Nocardiopsis lambiniae]|uniref:Uncharacterized protein n=1 Tax=Nocardiopsis lambiniae TaxID=3075539 RepID=A0ABU2MET4_9ACTN|nr:hypothetical protein [Nocardiopsis sp. DSM 44743]MDT0330776.1 hypothetical protein [Nocardiopsis sp. DSM 44743]